MNELVSIILPVHNSASFLRPCLESILKQTHKEIEIVAVDDNSKDESVKILREFRKKDKRIRIFKNVKRYGLAVILNRALQKARGSFIALTETEDINKRDRIKKQLLYLLSNPKVAAVGTQCVFLDSKNKKINKTDLPQEHASICQSLLPGISMQFQTVMINKHILPKDVLKFKPIPKPLIFSDVFMKVIRYGELANLSEHLQYHRQIHSMSTKTLNHLISLIKLWFKALTMYEYRPSILTLFTPLSEQI